MSGIQTADPPKKTTTMDLLRQLDEIFSPGLPEDVFTGLFLQCSVCHDIMTQRVFKYHLCLGFKPPSNGLVRELMLDDD
jgi:hypothetical protein